MPSIGNRRRLKKGDVDYISNLPDSILGHILSFLTTKSAVKTSILSKRWKYIWIKAPALDFTELTQNFRYSGLSLEQKVCFKSFVDRVLFHNEASYVQRFCLNIFDFDGVYAKSWLTAAANREIHELNFTLGVISELDICLPPRFLLSEKLVILKLAGPLSISSSMSLHLPNVKTIHLMFLKFPDDEFMKRLSSSCPVLRELHIVKCHGITSTLHVESLTLKSLKIMGIIEKAGQCIAIKTSNLTYLCLSNNLSLYDIGHMSSLVEADLTLYNNDSDFIVDPHQLFTDVSGVKILRLRCEEDYYLLEMILPLPVFCNLTYLQCEANNLLCKLLDCAPKLKSLILYRFSSEYPFDPESAPEHLPFLQRVEVFCLYFGQYQLDADEEKINMVAYFLKAASTLKEMNIELLCGTDNSITFYKKLLDLPRSSPVCRVKVN